MPSPTSCDELVQGLCLAAARSRARTAAARSGAARPAARDPWLVRVAARALRSAPVPDDARERRRPRRASLAAWARLRSRMPSAARAGRARRRASEHLLVEDALAEPSCEVAALLEQAERAEGVVGEVVRAARRARTARAPRGTSPGSSSPAPRVRAAFSSASTRAAAGSTSRDGATTSASA